MTKAGFGERLWTVLIEAALRIRQAAPWEWMADTDIFGVVNPEDGELCLISIMGRQGEYRCVAAFPGQKGMDGFFELHLQKTLCLNGREFEIPQLHCSFERREHLEKTDLRLVRRGGAAPLAHAVLPMFRSYRPGYFPWFLDRREAELMAHILNQTMDVALRFRNNATLLYPPDCELMIRRPEQKDGSLIWHDDVIPLPPPGAPRIGLKMDMSKLDNLKGLSKRDTCLDVDLFITPLKTGAADNARPQYSYALIIADNQERSLVGRELLDPLPSLEEMWASIPLHIVYWLDRRSVVPQRIRLRSELLRQILEPLAKALDIRISMAPALPMIDRLRDNLNS